MRLAITSTGKDLTSEVDPRFGRAAYFILIDMDEISNIDNLDKLNEIKYKLIDNMQNLDISQGAGIQAGKTIVDNKVDVVITGNCGPKAFKVLNSAGIKTILNAKGQIRDVILKFKKGELQTSQNPNVNGHWV